MANLTDASASSAAASISTASSATASTSTDAYPTTNCNKYDIFINHRGPDTKKTLASHLYYRLRSHGYRVFLDKPEMQPGKPSFSQIKEAIASSSVHIAILSPRYAESIWTLEELWWMLQSKATLFPIFYRVRPSEVPIRTGNGRDGLCSRVLTILGWTGNTGVYAHALRIHENEGILGKEGIDVKEGEPSELIAKWKTALSDVSKLSGFDLETFKGDEGELVEKVVQRVKETVRKPPLQIIKYPTGLYGMLQDFGEIVSLQQELDTRKAIVVAITGPVGVGKTTLAVEFFNSRWPVSYQSCFLMNVSETPLSSLQNQLIKDLASLDLKIDNIASGKGLISHHLSGIVALIILDGVDDACQLDALFSPLQNVLVFPSLIIVTSRNKNVLSGIGDSIIHNLTGLDREQSRELFCLHAFHKRLPDVGFEEMVTQFLDVCDGLPLSLEVLGGLLYERKMQHWQEQLRKISTVLPPEIQRRVQISYDGLDWHEKEIFLDIACVSRGEDKDESIRKWERSGWEGSLNFHNLENKCLVQIDSKNCICMHHHLINFGRYLAEHNPLSLRCRLLEPH